ncbi:MAG TPA: exosortase/archaeosortase family protein, partial [Phycisphaerae bacterium]|nr:exosortase/archaeosortase family protein [Phycisphaerae bacterium]
GSMWGLVVMLFSSAVYAQALRAKIGYPQPLSIITMIIGIVLLMRGWRAVWITLFPIAFLVLALPPPERLYRQITQPLQQGAAALATWILNCVPGAEVERMGINISYWMRGHAPGQFTVAGACSGMRSLMAFISIGLMLAYLTPRPLWHRVTMAIVVIPVALFCNVVRVVVTGLFQMYGHNDLAAGTPHMVLGLMTFALGFAIYMAILWFLDHLFVDSAESADVGAG